MAAFYARRDKTFWAYEPAVKPGPGTVLLDATADLGPIVSFLPGVTRSDPIRVDYSNLEVVHIEMPKSFFNVKRTLHAATCGTSTLTADVVGCVSSRPCRTRA
jgi:hypothetical protein